MKDEEFYVNMAHRRDSDPMFNGELYDETRRFFPAYIWYRPSRSEKGKHVGWCSKCGEFIDEDVFSYMTSGKSKLHNETAECPHCGVRVTLKCEGKMRNYSTLCTDANIAYFYSPDPDLVYIRVFRMQANYSNTDDPFPSFEKLYPTEVARYRLAPGEWISERHDWYGNMHSTKEPFEPALTSKNMVHALCGADTVLPKSFLKYHQLEELHDNAMSKSIYSGIPCRYCYGIEYRPLRYLCYFAELPQLEMVAKLGLTWAVSDLVNERKKNARLLDWNAKKPHEFLRLSKEDAKEYLGKYAMQKEILVLLQKAKGKIGCKDAAMIAHAASGDRAYELLDILIKYGLRCEKVTKYTTKNKITVWDYLDYVKGAQEIGYDLTVHNVLFPKNFHEAHNAAIKGLAVVEFKKLSKSKQKALEKRAKRYEYNIHGCVFVFPRSVAEIVAEGKSLGHCVGGYAARHIDGSTTIVFMRKADKPDISWFTIEMNGNSVRQAYGKKNRVRPQEDKEASRAFYLWRCHLEHKVKRFAGSFKNMRYRKIA